MYPTALPSLLARWNHLGGLLKMKGAHAPPRPIKSGSQWVGPRQLLFLESSHDVSPGRPGLGTQQCKGSLGPKGAGGGRGGRLHSLTFSAAARFSWMVQMQPILKQILEWGSWIAEKASRAPFQSFLSAASTPSFQRLMASARDMVRRTPGGCACWPEAGRG